MNLAQLVKRFWRASTRGRPDVAQAAMAEIEKQERAMKVTRLAVAQALRSPIKAERVKAFTDLFPVAPPPFSVPQGKELREAIAMDMKPHYEAAMDWQTLNASPVQIGWHAADEGVGFFGYPYLAQLTQRAEYRMITEIKAEEMTRKWIKFTYSGDGDMTERLDEIEKWFKRHEIRAKFRQMTEQDGQFGRSQIYIDTGSTDDPPELEKPLLRKKEKIPKGSVKAFRVVEPLWTYPNRYNALDPLKPDYFKPETWFVMGKKVHKSRLLTMVSRPMPDLLKAAYAFGGLAMAQMAKPYVDNWLRNRQSTSDLVSAFSTMILATDMQALLQGGPAEDMNNRLDIFNAFRGNFGTMVINKESEELTNINTPLSGLEGLLAQSQQQMASVARTPLVKLLGITPSGLNASSDGEIRVYYDGITAEQQREYRPHLEDVLIICQLDLGYAPDEGISFEFVPLWELDEAGKATVRKTDADTAAVLIEAGILDPSEDRKRIADDPASPWYGIDAEDMPEPPQEEGEPGEGDIPGIRGDPARHAEPAENLRSGDGAIYARDIARQLVRHALDAEWEESKHPRGFGGKFGHGTGSKKEDEPQGDEFNAHEYAQSQDDPNVTVESLMASLPEHQREELARLHEKIASRGSTHEKFKDKEGAYHPDRAKSHEEILYKGRYGRDPDNPGKLKWYDGILAPDRVKAATPAPGEKPTFTMLGGRGGSGKSKLKGEVYSDDNAIVLDADVIKHMIEEYEGWNANEVHEESSDILERALRVARGLGLNVVLDATLKSSGGALEKVEAFKEAGYRLEAHYMHLPRQEAAKRAIERYFSPSKKSPELRGRYVVPHLVLQNRLNENNFDEVRKQADRWSFRDNNVKRGEEPRLIAREGYDDAEREGNRRLRQAA